MAHFKATIDSPISAEAVFEYMADFSNAVYWDPTVTRVETPVGNKVGLCAQYEVFLGTDLAEVSLSYATTRFEPDQFLCFKAENSFLRSLDTIEIEAMHNGCRLHYDADIRLHGLGNLFDFPVHLAFQGSGRRSLAGLETALLELT